MWQVLINLVGKSSENNKELYKLSYISVSRNISLRRSVMIYLCAHQIICHPGTLSKLTTSSNPVARPIARKDRIETPFTLAVMDQRRASNVVLTSCWTRYALRMVETCTKYTVWPWESRKYDGNGNLRIKVTKMSQIEIPRVIIVKKHKSHVR